MGTSLSGPPQDLQVAGSKLSGLLDACAAQPERLDACAGGERIGEVALIPVYDRSFPNKGVRAVIEVMMQQGAAEPMAEVITYISSALNLLQVWLLIWSVMPCQ